MRRVAIIDLGTNTFNLLIAEINGAKYFKKIFSHRISVMLGEGTINTGIISEKPFRRGIEALKEFHIEIEKHSAKQVMALATSAIRSASNGHEFIKAAREEANVNVEIISGDKEAELIYLGNSAATELSFDSSLIMDIGGGSTEFIIGNKNGIFWEQSFMLGAARLLARFKPEDPITADTIKKIENYLEQELKPLFEAIEKYQVIELIGSSGVFDSFAELIDVNFSSMNFTENKISYDFKLEEYHKISATVLASTLAERKVMKGLVPMRVEMIVVSFVFVNFILKRLQLNKMRCTTWSLKEGAIVEMMGSFKSGSL